jgi:hypothetical protein
VHVLTLTDGLKINGSDFVAGLTKQLPSGVNLTGGLAGDRARFGETLVFRDGVPCKDTFAALGIYGSRLRIGYSSRGGWDSFGPERLITRSAANVLYELDGQPALSLYKKYLGEHARELPAAGLFFPLSIRTTGGRMSVVRTILAVDEDAQPYLCGRRPGGRVCAVDECQSRSPDRGREQSGTCEAWIRSARLLWIWLFSLAVSAASLFSSSAWKMK